MATTTTPQKSVKKIPKIPDSSRFFGNIPEMNKDVVGFFHRCQQEHNEIFEVTFIRDFKGVFVFNSDMIKHVLVKNNRNYVKSLEYKTLKRVLGNGILVSEGDFWRKQRRLAQPAFHRQRLANLNNLMVDCTQTLLEDLAETPANKAFDLHEKMMQLTMDIVSRALFSFEKGAEGETIAKVIEAGNHYINYQIRFPFPFTKYLPVPTNLKWWRLRGSLAKVMMDVIRDRQMGKVTDKDDLMQMLVEVQDEDTGKKMSTQQLFDEALTIFVAGHETTAVALSWVWYLLGKNPDKAAKLYEEVDRVLGNRTPTMEDLRQLTYTRWVIDETMRLYPPAWIMGRQPLEEDNICGYPVPKENMVKIFVYGIHRDPRFYTNPDAFEPERFAPEIAKQRPKYAYLPFGGGPRLCIGNNFALMEMQIVLAMMAQRFRFRLAKPDETIGLEPLVTLRPKGGVAVFVEKRRGTNSISKATSK
ncbi:MAG: cytochrome P450 [Chitinophagales bacterium]